MGKDAKKAAGLLSNVFSVIPIAGGLISKFLESDVDITEKENEKFLEETLIDTIHVLSKEIKDLKSEEGKSRDQLIFIIDNFQFINDKMFSMIEKIRDRIKDEELSPEKNNIAFLLLINTDYRSDIFEKFKYSSVIPSNKEFNYYLYGFTKDMALEYYHNILNFGRTRKNDDLLDKIIEIYGEKYNDEVHIFPKYITETLLNEVNFITEKYNSFYYTGIPLNISISPSVYFEYIRKIDLLKPIEKKILEAASILGNQFNINEVAAILNKDSLYILDEIRILEKEGEIIVRVSPNGDFKFRKGVYREAFKKGILLKLNNEDGKDIPFQIFIEYCNRASIYFAKMEKLTIDEKERFAIVSKSTSRDKLNISLKAILSFSLEVFKIPGYQIKGVTFLDDLIMKVLDSIKYTHKKRSISEILDHYSLFPDFIKAFSFYYNYYREYIPINFPNLKIFMDEISANNKYFNYQNGSFFNHCTQIFSILNHQNFEGIILSKSFNQKALDLNQSGEEKVWSEYWLAYLNKVEGNLILQTNPERAQELYNSSMTICEVILNDAKLIKDEYWSKNLISRIYIVMAECNQKLSSLNLNNQNIYLTAEKYFNLSIEYQKLNNDYTGLGISYKLRSDLYSLKPDGYEKARADLEECRKLNEEIKNYTGLQFTLINLAELEKKFNKDYKSYQEEAEKIGNVNHL